MRGVLTAAVAWTALALMSAGTAWAQKTPVSSFEDLPSVLKVGDQVYVTDGSGREHKGTVSEFPPSSIKLVIPGTIKEFTAADVVAIKRLQHDSLTSGALIGLGVGVACGIAIGAFAAEENNTDTAGSAAMAGAVYGGLGALIGMGFDALSPGKKILVYRGERAKSARLSILPIVQPRRQAIVARISF